MKLMHLSDLHLGKRVNEFSMLEDQEYILTEIIRIIDEQKPQAVIIAGDVYDKSIPSAEAVRLFDRFLVQLSQRRLKVFVISGNHDSAERIAFGGRLMDKSGIYLSPVFDRSSRAEHPITLEDEFGKVHFYLLPFIKPAHVRAVYPEEQIESYTDAVKTAIDHMHLDHNERNILVTHQFVTGALRSESEELTVGGTDNVDAGVLEGFDYVALGHIHRAQKCGSEFIRYSGTPLKYSFSEAKDNKTVTMVELKQKGDIELSFVPLVPLHDMVELKETFHELTQESFYQSTTYPTDYLHITLTDEEDIPDVLAKLRKIYCNTMKLDYDNQRTRHSVEITGAADVQRKTTLEHFAELYEMQNGQGMSDEQTAFLKKIIEEIEEGEQ